MSDVIRNRYDFVVLFDVQNGNPNGDPDAGNMPRTDPETGLGLVTDVCLKRKIRDYVATVKEGDPHYGIYIQDGVPLNRCDREGLEACGYGDIKEDDLKKKLKSNDPEIDRKLRDYMCSHYYDIRTFGAVMTTFVKASLNCGQVRGPVQLGFARSVPATVHFVQFAGENTHHILEACFKGAGHALGAAVKIDEAHKDEIPSTKGLLV